MSVALWIAAGLLALVFAGAGAMKLSQPKSKLVANPNLGWTEDFSEGMIKMIGGLEVLAAIGLVVTPLLGLGSVLAPLAALGLTLLMIGAVITHVRRKETQPLAINIVLLLLAVFVAWGRFGDYSF
jgi:uncharacterized membrane protein YphA (DoxX/SURF4 family)